MRSVAQFKGHPVHPMLIPFPFAFLVGAFAFDLAGRVLGYPAFWHTGGYLALAGIGTGLVAAIPGVIDLLYAVPPRSTGRRRAVQHALVNLGAIALFGLAWWGRGAATVPPTMTTLGLEAVGVALLGMGGWMGGTLVYRNEIGVDRRYAGAGKWREARVTAHPGRPVAVADAGELEIDQMKLVRADGRRIVLGRTEQGYVAFDDHCTHRGGSLAGGTMICGTVQCPWHGSQFDAATGTVRRGPARRGIAVYEVRQESDRIDLVIPE